jgi:hypothetical protein
MSERIQSYREFWPYYLKEHSKPATRSWHIAGTSLSTLVLVTGLASGSVALIVAAVLVGYGPAWAAHFLIEKNRPATFRYPFWSLISDYRMVGLWVAGGLSAELAKAGVSNGNGTTNLTMI